VAKTKQIELMEDLPAPGEPLVHQVNSDNRKLLDDEIAERMATMRAKLTKKAYARAQRDYKKLRNYLSRAGWNQLIQTRYEVGQRYEAEKHAYTAFKAGLGFEISEAEMNRLRADENSIRAWAHKGRDLNAQIARLQPSAEVFDTLLLKFTSHKQALKYEREDEENHKAFLREARAWEHQIKAVFKQSGRLHHKGENRKGNTFIIIPKIERIMFKDDRVLYLIKTTAQSSIERMLGKWHSALPYNVDVGDLTCDETLENLSAACNRVVSIERSKVGTNLFYAVNRLDSPDGIPRKVLYSKVIDWYPTADHAKPPGRRVSPITVKWNGSISRTPRIF